MKIRWEEILKYMGQEDNNYFGLLYNKDKATIARLKQLKIL